MMKSGVLLNTLEVIFCIKIIKRGNQTNLYSISYLRTLYCIFLLVLIMPIEYASVSYINENINSLIQTKIGSYVFLMTALSQALTIFLGLNLTLSLSKSLTKPINVILKCISAHEKRIQELTFTRINKVLILLTFTLSIFVGLDAFVNLGSQPMFDISFFVALVTYQFIEYYSLYSKVYWTHILLTVEEYIKIMKADLRTTLLDLEAKHTKEEKVEKVHSISENLFVVLDNISEVSYLYTPQVMSDCGKFVMTTAPMICYVIELLMKDVLNLRPFLVLLYMMNYFSKLSWVVFAYVSVIKEVKEVAAAIHEIVTTGKVDAVSEELFNFSMAILHKDFHFSAFGFFNIDFTLVFMVMGNVVHYLVILSQFQFSSTGPSVSPAGPSVNSSLSNTTTN